MLVTLSLMTAVKDYVEVVHKFVESSPDFQTNPTLMNYWDGGAILTYMLLVVKQLCFDVLSFQWLRQLWSLPLVVPDIASALVSELSVWDAYLHNQFTFLETPWSEILGEKSLVVQMSEKWLVGALNSLFLFFPSSIAHVIMFRRFYVQGLPAGFAAGLGTVVGNVTWIASVVFGFRFILIPWLSLDWLRYLVGFSLLVKYMADTQQPSEQYYRFSLPNQKLRAYFLLNFLLAWVEQVSIYPFLSNLGFGSDGSVLESFPANSLGAFICIHGAYVLGILIGSLSLLFLVYWFWDNQAMNVRDWLDSLTKRTSPPVQKMVNVLLRQDSVEKLCLYLTMLATVSSFPYYALDYLIMNPVGFVHPDRLIYRTMQTERAATPNNPLGDPDLPRVWGWFSVRPEEFNTRRSSSGRVGRSEYWKGRLKHFRTFDTMLYDTGTYHFMPLEDTNFGFDRFWLRRKLRNRKTHFRVFPGPWMRRMKANISKPRLLGKGGIRYEFFDRLQEQAYHPSLHAPSRFSNRAPIRNSSGNKQLWLRLFAFSKTDGTFTRDQRSAWLRKFVRKTNRRVLSSRADEKPSGFTVLENKPNVSAPFWQGLLNLEEYNTPLAFENQANMLISNGEYRQTPSTRQLGESTLSRREMRLLRYRELLKSSASSPSRSVTRFARADQTLVLRAPLQMYLDREQALERKWRYYGAKGSRTLNPGRTAPYIRTALQRIFQQYKPNQRLYNTLQKAQNEVSPASSPVPFLPTRVPLRFEASRGSSTSNSLALRRVESMGGTKDSAISNMDDPMNRLARLQKPTHAFSLSSTNAQRYRYWFFRDTMQHWYYRRPMRRMLMKLDIDSFIRRQPRAHLLTAQDEKLLHARRFLLSEHYNSLRWYRWMQNHASMRDRIGSTKSFATRAYNQQFNGTLRKIRHLFAITPAESFNSAVPNAGGKNNARSILKFDQPLYNEYTNSSGESLVGQSWLHEELWNDGSSGRLGENPLDHSENVLRRIIQDDHATRMSRLEKAFKQVLPVEMAKVVWEGRQYSAPKPNGFGLTYVVDKANYTGRLNLNEELSAFDFPGPVDNPPRRIYEMYNNFVYNLWFHGMGDMEERPKLLKKFWRTDADSSYLTSSPLRQFAGTSATALANTNTLIQKPSEFGWMNEQDDSGGGWKRWKKWRWKNKIGRLVGRRGMNPGSKNARRDIQNQNLEQDEEYSLEDRTSKMQLEEDSKTPFLRPRLMPSDGSRSLLSPDQLKRMGSRLQDLINRIPAELRNNSNPTYLNYKNRLAQVYMDLAKKDQKPQLSTSRELVLYGSPTTITEDQNADGSSNFFGKTDRTPPSRKAKTDWFGNKFKVKDEDMPPPDPEAYYQAEGRATEIWQRNYLIAHSWTQAKKWGRIAKKTVRNPAWSAWKNSMNEPFPDQFPFGIKATDGVQTPHSVDRTGWPMMEEANVKYEGDSNIRPFNILKSLDVFYYWMATLDKYDRQQQLSYWWWNNLLPDWQKQLNAALREVLAPPDETVVGKNPPRDATLVGEKRLVSTHPLPFYAGWDESLRKFVVTNRLLAATPSTGHVDATHDVNSTYPIKGLQWKAQGWNMLTQWQVPFLSYGALKNTPPYVDAFAPLGWRRFQFRHSLVTAWKSRQAQPDLDDAFAVQNMGTTGWAIVDPGASLSVRDYVKSRGFKRQAETRTAWELERKRAGWKVSRFESPYRVMGQLSHEVLPIHFLRAFQPKDSRSPENRYLQRSPRTADKLNGETGGMVRMDFTWRRRALAQRKRHRRRLDDKQIRARVRAVPHRRRWIAPNETPHESFAWRPMGMLAPGKRKKAKKSAKADSERTLEARKLLRRSAVMRPRTTSYTSRRMPPLPGDFMWPGDYARLKDIPALKEFYMGGDQNFVPSFKRDDWVRRQYFSAQKIQYLAERHNVQVYKKRMKKMGRNLIPIDFSPV